MHWRGMLGQWEPRGSRRRQSTGEGQATLVCGWALPPVLISYARTYSVISCLSSVFGLNSLIFVLAGSDEGGSTASTIGRGFPRSRKGAAAECVLIRVRERARVGEETTTLTGLA